jgi:hypothetical protein
MISDGSVSVHTRVDSASQVAIDALALTITKGQTLGLSDAGPPKDLREAPDSSPRSRALGSREAPSEPGGACPLGIPQSVHHETVPLRVHPERGNAKGTLSDE